MVYEGVSICILKSLSIKVKFGEERKMISLSLNPLRKEGEFPRG